MRSKSKILFFPGDYPFCYYHRGFVPGVYSDSLVFKDFPKMGKEGMKEASELVKEADIIVFQRPNNKEILNLIRTAKKMGKKVIFENDDTYLLGKGIDLSKLQNDTQRQIATDFSKYTDLILRECDGAIASTKILADEYSKINPNVVVLKNTLDPLDEVPNAVNTTGKFRIGFVGSVTTNDDYIHIKDQIKRLDERGDITIVILGVKYKDGTHMPIMRDDYLFWSSIKNIEWHPYVNVTEYMSSVASLALDLAIIPRADNYFNRCKSNIKFLEMSLLRIPVVAQGFSDGQSPYQGVDEKYMTVVVDNNEWYNTIVKIKQDYESYSHLANTAHDYVLTDYNIKTYAKEWRKQILKLCK